MSCRASLSSPNAVASRVAVGRYDRSFALTSWDSLACWGRHEYARTKTAEGVEWVESPWHDPDPVKDLKTGWRWVPLTKADAALLKSEKPPSLVARTRYQYIALLARPEST